MTRYSASRGIMYSAPPTPDDSDETETEMAQAEPADASEPAAADD